MIYTEVQMRFEWEHYKNTHEALVNSWLDDVAIKFTGLDDPGTDFRNTWKAADSPPQGTWFPVRFYPDRIREVSHFCYIFSVVPAASPPSVTVGMYNHSCHGGADTKKTKRKPTALRYILFPLQ